MNARFHAHIGLTSTKRVEEWVHKAIAKHAGIVWLDRMAIFKVKSAFLSSQTIPACFAIALWTHSSTRFVTGEFRRDFCVALPVNRMYRKASSSAGRLIALSHSSEGFSVH